MPTLSTHVLDVAAGRPAVGLAVALSPLSNGPDPESESESESFVACTGVDGRITEGLGGNLAPGRWKLSFDLGSYYAATNTPGCIVSFDVTLLLDEERHYHVPLLATPFSASSYLGT